jgi:hypothetical protein
MDYKELLTSRKYNANKLPEREQIILSIDNKNVGSLQNFVIITGMQKNGKSRYASAMAAAAIIRQEVFGISVKLPNKRNRVCYVDTEQSDWDFYKMMDGIKRMAALEKMPDHFDCYNFREDNTVDIIEMTETYLKENSDCSIIFLDGLLDYVKSFNDEEECNNLVRKIMKWGKVYNILIVAIMHRGKTNASTIGHLGAIADRKTQSILSVNKNKERVPASFVLASEFLRSADDFDPIEIYYNTGSHAWEKVISEPKERKIRVISTLPKLKPQEYDIQEHIDITRRIFTIQASQSHQVLIGNIREQYCRSIMWSKELIPYLMEKNIIFKTDDGYFTNQKIQRLWKE